MGLGGLGGDIFGGMDFLDITGSKSGAKQAKRIAELQRKAYEDLKGISTADQDKAALDQALKNYLDQQEFLKKYSPGAYSAYQSADEALGLSGRYAPTATKNAIELAEASKAENLPNRLADTERLASDQSAEMLRLGGSLSPEMQAELMRSGFGATAGSGGVSGSTAARSGMARQLASDQLRIQQQRQNMASNLTGTATGIRASRNAALNAALGAGMAPNATAGTYAQSAGELASARTPGGYGVGGETAASNYTSNLNLENEKTLGKAGVDVARSTALYNAARAPVTAGTTAIGAFIGGYFGNPQGGAAAGKALSSGG